MRWIFFSTIGIAFWLLSSCGTVNHWEDHEVDVDFSMYKTYQIDEQCSDYNPGINPINQQRIKNAIEIELREMGYQRSDDPDINVKFFVKNETKYFYEQCLQEYDRLVGGNRCIEKVYTYDEGTLVIDLIDIRKNMAIWHGGAKGESWENMKDADSKIQKMVGAIMQDYRDLISTPGYAHQSGTGNY